MNKKLSKVLTLILIMLTLAGCSFMTQDGTNNNITNKVVTVENFTLGDFETSLQTAIQKAEESVIAIMHTDGGIFGGTSLGSAVVLKRTAILKNNSLGEVAGNIDTYQYLAVTNRHVVVTTSNNISKNLVAYLGDDTSKVSATCINYSTKEDLALFSFKSSKYLPVAVLEDTTNLKKGTFCIAIGCPYDLGYYGSATFGIVSYPIRYLEDEKFILGKTSYGTVENAYIQHDASINAGNSGGGLFNVSGKLLGLNTLKIQSESSDVIEGMGFSIPSHVIMYVFSDYLK